MPAYYSDEKYKGLETIVVAMDIGTTQSAVSFAHFVPGSKPQGNMVINWPGQAHWNGAAKTPSMVSYRDRVVKCGAEAMQDFDEHPESVAHWFKVTPYPTASNSHLFIPRFEVPPLPRGITPERVYADMMRYLMENTQRFFEMTIANGAEIWTRVRGSIVIVLATPNGWDIREQAVLRNAAIKASLVAEESAGRLVQFVTEAEASVHYALANQETEWLRKKAVFAVIDCGGSTVDTTVYRCISTNPLALNEACPSECVQAGGIFVNREVKRMLENRLKGSSFSDPEILKSMTDAFEVELKPKFDGKMEQYHLKFGVLRDNDPNLGINRGKINLSNKDLRPVFDAVTDQIVKSCSKAISKQNVKYILLVGGFAESPYVRSVLANKLLHRDMQLITVGDYAKKAAAEGAIIGRIKQFVVARAARATFGGCVRPVYDKNLHHDRRHTVQVYPDGKKRVDGAFHMWITMGTVMQGTFAHKLSYHVAWDAISTSKKDLLHGLGTIGIEIFAWEGNSAPTWCKDENGVVLEGMRPICTLSANLSALAGGLQIRNGPRGKRFYRVDYDVYVYFGGTQLHAKLQWKEGKALCESEVKVMPYIS